MEVKNESFEELFKVEETKKLRRIKPGEKITATIVGIGQEPTFLDVGGKSEGVLNSSELADKEGRIELDEDQLTALVPLRFPDVNQHQRGEGGAYA